MPNRLADQASLYLRQHAANPVDWWPWCPEAFADARDRDVPVLLSVGYSSCHWCHVMAHESFEDDATAALMNEWFTCVKVDREELPDVDALYMQATVAMSGHGGWPMTVFLTPGGEPFWAGTYFPPQPRQGMPAFTQVLNGVAEAWRDRRDQVMRQAGSLADGLRQQSAVEVAAPPPAKDAVAAAVRGLGDLYDDEHGGFGGAPKFPPSVVIDLLLRRHWAGRDPGGRALAMATGTLDAMAAGGVCDQVGGGFHRYSVDDIWLVPHFEKMLYDNALLLRDYALAVRLTGEDRHGEVAGRIAEYLLREMRTEGGAFAAAQDADSPGGEGAFFTWTPDEIRDLLPATEAEAVIARFGVSERGNFEGRNILRVVAPEVAVQPSALEVLYEARALRPAPDRDDKVIASWNGLAIGALAEAGMGMRRDDWTQAAREAARFVLDEMVVDGRLMRVHADGRARHLGTLEDHADMADGLMALYAAEFDPQWVLAARALADAMLGLFADPAGAGFFMSGTDAPPLIARTRDLEDHPSPSGNSQAAWVLARLHLLTGEPRYRDAAAAAVGLVSAQAQRWPQAFARALATADLLDSRSVEVAVVGTLDDPRTAALVDAARAAAGPYAVVAAGDPADPGAATAAPLLADRPLVHGAPAAYACSGFTCRAPVSDPDALVAALRGG
ncbi:MAG: thioredoxin domain-containing protein [Actinobacteria bacterium]|nr:thioredoxin domain-containing protein [Actinomycetota bacterium]